MTSLEKVQEKRFIELVRQLDDDKARKFIMLMKLLVSAPKEQEHELFEMMEQNMPLDAILEKADLSMLQEDSCYDRVE